MNAYGKTRISAGREFSATAQRNIQFTSVDTSSGSRTFLLAGGNILDFALDRVTVQTHYHKKGYTRDKWIQSTPSFHRSDGSISSIASGIQDLFGTQFKGKEAHVHGTMGVNFRETHDSHEHESVSKKENGLFRKSKQSHTKSFSAQSKGADLKFEDSVKVTSSKDITLVNVNIQAPKTVLTSLEGVVRILLGTNQSSMSSMEMRSNGFWQKQSSKIEEHQTFSASQFSGDVEIRAKEALLQAIKGKPLEFIDRITIVNGKITHDFVEELHQYESHSTEGPTAALAMLVAIAITLATSGAGTAVGSAAAEGMGLATAATAAVAATTTTAGAALQGMVVGSFTGLCSQAGVALLSAKGDLGEALKSVMSTNTLKSLAVSVAAAGVISGVANAFEIPTVGGDCFGNHLKYHSLRVGVETVFRGKGIDIEDMGRSVAMSTAGGFLAHKIGMLRAEKIINSSAHKVLHGFLGGPWVPVLLKIPRLVL